MTDSGEYKDGLKLTDRATLSLLSAIEAEEQVTQRGLAARIGVALGLTNSLLKRAVRKGLVKIQQAPAKRYAYYVTPRGLTEKSRLVAEYLSTSLDFFRQARAEYNAVFEDVVRRGHAKVALYGTGELVEIVSLYAQNGGIEVAAVIQAGSNQPVLSGIPVVPSIEAAREHDVDAVVIACSHAPQKAYDTLRAHFADEQIFAAPLLHVTRDADGSKDGEAG